MLDLYRTGCQTVNAFWLRHLGCCLLIASATTAAGQDTDLQTTHRIPLTITWGHTSPPHSEFAVRVVGREVALDPAVAVEQEPTDAFALGDEFWQTRAGGADVDGIACTVTYRDMPLGTIADLNSIWRDLIAQSDPDTARRLQQDAGLRLDARQLTIQLNRDATRGFTVTIDQLLQHRSFWVPALDVFVAVGDDPPTLDAHRQEMMRSHGPRILDQVHRDPDADYAQYIARWEDMGSPAYQHPSQPAPGHIVGLTWDSAVPKFGIDRGAGVWNDLGNPDRFRLECDMGRLTQDLKTTWRGQCLADGLPILTTRLAREPVRVEMEQFAYPLHGPPSERRGDISLVLLQKIIIENTSDAPQVVPLRLTHWRERPADAKLAGVREGDRLIIQDATSGQALLYVQGANVATSTFAELAAPAADTGTADTGTQTPSAYRWRFRCPWRCRRRARGSWKSGCRRRSYRPRTAQRYWRWTTRRRGRQRVHTGPTGWPAGHSSACRNRSSMICIAPVSGTHCGCRGGMEDQSPACGSTCPTRTSPTTSNGTPWPVNQAVYVDYMIYDLRGYHDVSLDELLHMYRNNQQPDGRIGGYANWGVYTPSMVYASAQHYLLSHDRAAFERLLPPTLKALDWCLQQMRSSANDSSSMGLVRAPLNDLTGEGLWAFNQAYVYAALRTLGEALDRFGHPRAGECRAAAREFATVVERAFATAAVQSPLVQLRDGSWIPYVPCEATTPRRRFDQWYPTDVDTGAVHLLRLGALPARAAGRLSVARPRRQLVPARLGDGQRTGVQSAGDGLSAA